MQHLSVVIAQKDQAAASQLATTLRGRFRHVAVAHSSTEIHDAILKNRANAAIVDLELLKSDDFRQLCQEFDHTAIVATHRSPDEKMWMACLENGAADCCQRTDVEGMLRAIANNVALTRAASAA
ncbi:hypothetical protein [Candidatus Korobacter versatilis]|uniref:hypothetical protein n=1 Tax=Candidatus Korobacter versatilis TaxID=658062 RepID=UPI0002DA2393|nr:hypothetical protein [Candidatus Koribacter versatilis]